MIHIHTPIWGRCGRDHKVVGFTTIYVISAYHHEHFEIESHSWQGVLATTSWDKFCQWLGTGWCFFQCTPVSSTNKPDYHDITEILLKVALSTITIHLSWMSSRIIPGCPNGLHILLYYFLIWLPCFSTYSFWKQPKITFHRFVTVYHMCE